MLVKVPLSLEWLVPKISVESNHCLLTFTIFQKSLWHWMEIQRDNLTQKKRTLFYFYFGSWNRYVTLKPRIFFIVSQTMVNTDLVFGDLSWTKYCQLSTHILDSSTVCTIWSFGLLNNMMIMMIIIDLFRNYPNWFKTRPKLGNWAEN